MIEYIGGCLPGSSVQDTLRDQSSSSDDVLRSRIFIRDLFALTVACPVLIFCCMSPLWFSSIMDYEVWNAYYWFCIIFASLLFSRNLLNVCVGVGPQLCAMVICACIVAAAGTAMQVWYCRTPLVALRLSLISVVCSIYVPTLWLVRLRGDRTFNLATALIATMAFSCATALQAIVSAFMYYGCQAFDCHRAPVATIWFVLWTGTACLLKAMGAKLWKRAAPSCTAMGPEWWILYIETTWNCLGLRVFFVFCWSSFLYSISFPAILAFHWCRGTSFYYTRMRPAKSLCTHRVNVFLESFATLLGRLMALSMYVCYSAMQVIRGKEEEPTHVLQHSVFKKQMITTLTMDVYRNSQVNFVCPCMGIVCILTVVLSYAAFMLLASSLWVETNPSKIQVTPEPELTSVAPAMQTVQPRLLGNAYSHEPAWGSRTARDQPGSAISSVHAFADTCPGNNVDAEALEEGKRRCSKSIPRKGPRGHQCGAGGGADLVEKISENQGSVLGSEEAVQTPQSWWNSSSLGQHLGRPVDLLNTFIMQYRSMVLATVVFVFTSSSLILNLVDDAIWRETGEPVC